MGSSYPQRGTAPQFLAHVCYDQMAGWIKMPLGTEVDLGADHIVLHGDPVPPSSTSPLPKGAQQPPLLADIYCEL